MSGNFLRFGKEVKREKKEKTEEFTWCAKKQKKLINGYPSILGNQVSGTHPFNNFTCIFHIHKKLKFWIYWNCKTPPTLHPTYRKLQTQLRHVCPRVAMFQYTYTRLLVKCMFFRDAEYGKSMKRGIIYSEEQTQMVTIYLASKNNNSSRLINLKLYPKCVRFQNTWKWSQYIASKYMAN